ncbi:MAG TPA: right-handed parallel beta-helix repeat-containing protein [Thermoanaerobaculia bacterium]|nr:right-handed parallel beta-helix repeat-containing protein [Thermoanaerobaculia bacterium]
MFLLFAAAARGATVSVGCPGGTPGTYPSINAALATLDNEGPHTINVSGTCTETVTIDQRQRLTIQGAPLQIATVVGSNTCIVIRDSVVVTLRNLILSGTQSAISAAQQSSINVAGVTASASNGVALDIFGGASAVLGGAAPMDAVVVQNSNIGMRIEGSDVFVRGWFTSQNNVSSGILIDSGRLETSGSQPTPPLGGPVTIQNNFTGITAQNGGLVQLFRGNFIQNNQGNGVILTTGAILHVAGGTVIEGNQTSGVAVLFNSTMRFQGSNSIIRNNGSASSPFRSGISANHSSMVWVGAGAQIIDNTGRGILADSGTTVRLDNTTITGNTESGIELIHGAILESIVGNTVPVNGAASVLCDATTIVFGDLAGVGAFECEKKEGKK